MCSPYSLILNDVNFAMCSPHSLILNDVNFHYDDVVYLIIINFPVTSFWTVSHTSMTWSLFYVVAVLHYHQLIYVVLNQYPLPYNVVLESQSYLSDMYFLTSS